ncbi:MAG: bifunctional phosphoribosylaminoimidazolecarboxamide formyltransferase/IMP cyclohydrolase [Bacteroidales bacterium]|nr:bifunctional phosphoribosylaminoimidazolecarboxamide formyltransferase/IMP cyclohydrolase [Bacteroidales bacterium]
MKKSIKSALISVFHKENLDEIVRELIKNDVTLYSTGGTQAFLESLGAKVIAVESLTDYPSILGGRVKTLHPKVFGGILNRRDNSGDQQQIEEYQIPEIDLVIVDLYPFEATVASKSPEQDIIEKIDIGGISLIRAAAKNFKDVAIVASQSQYRTFLEMYLENNGATTIEQRRQLAAGAFAVSSHYDSAIFNYFNEKENLNEFRESTTVSRSLRYGENPHQEARFYGDFDAMFEQLHGKEVSYNNLLDIDAAVNLIDDFSETTFAILKHNNACGLASRNEKVQAWKDALAGDPVSAFGGIVVTNVEIDKAVAEEMNTLFMEVCIAPSYTNDALEILKSKKNRILLVRKSVELPKKTFRTALNGILYQDKDIKVETVNDLKTVTKKAPTEQEVVDLLFANKLVKHTKSNTIVLAKNGQLLASGTGQTSRIDALKQAVEKAKSFNFNLNGAVMASDAFFPFSDSVEIAKKAGITAVIQPGGSIKDQDSIDFCNENGMSMVFTGIRHFKH